MKEFFPPEFKLRPENCSKHHPALRCRPEFNYWGDRDVDHSQIIGGDAVKLLKGIHPPHPLPPPPVFGTPVPTKPSDRASATEWIDLSSIPSLVKPKTIKSIIYNFPAWRFFLSLNRKFWKNG